MTSRGASVILVYHRVADLDHDPQHLAVRPSTFEAHLAAIRRVGDVVPLGAVVERHADRRVAITFDDGYRDNATEAAPRLRDAGLPATFFVTTDVLQDRELWWDRLEHLTLGARARSGRIEVSVAGRDLVIDMRTGEGRARANRALSRRLRTRTPDEIAAVLDEVAAQVERVDECRTHGTMSRDEVATLDADPLHEVGAHTRSHANLGVLDEASQREEIAGSRDDLARVLGHAPASFAYPFGMRGSFDGTTERLVREAGYALACANVPGRIGRRDRFRLPRHIAPECEADDLARRVAAWLDAQ